MSNLSFSRLKKTDLRPWMNRYGKLLFISALLSTAPVIGATPTSPAPGTEILNQATGSFNAADDPVGTTPTVVESNVVKVTISEVAGITVTASGSNDDGSVNPDDVISFDFTITNVGNDHTQFVIPDSPSSITNGALSGPIEVIEYDSDGTGTSPVALSNVTVPQGGGSVTTGSLLNSVVGTNNGSVPPAGTITIRIPVQVDSAVGDGDQVTVVLGDTTTVGEQNQPLTAGTDDVATQDNADTDNGDVTGAPTNGEREASADQSVTAEADLDGDGIPDSEEGTGDRDNDGIPDNEDFDPQGYFYDEETGQILSGGSLSITPPPGGSVNLVDDGNATGNYQWIASGAAGIYTTVITPPPGYIISPTCVESTPAYDPTGNPNPDSLGASEDASTGRLTSNLCGANPYYISFDLAPGDPLIINNNYPFIPDPGRDYGDAPDTYGTTQASGGASHVIVGGLHLGTTAPDFEADAAVPLDGTGDGNAEEDGITLATLSEGDTTYTIAATDVTATNTTGTTATLHAWVDFDGSGTFEVDEYTSQPVQSGNSNPDGALAWSGAGVSGIAGGTTTYARFRLTTYGLTDDTGTAALDERAVGPATSGEVEDYAVAIAASSNPNVVLVKRITAINGDPLNNPTSVGDRTQNPNDNSFVLNTVVNDGINNSPDDESRWPANYLLGQVNAGPIKPGDYIEYTVYFLNTGADGAEDVRICDWIQPNQSVVTGLYGGNDIELQLSEGAGLTTYNLTMADDAGDRAQLATVGTLPAGPNCNLPATATTLTDNVLVIDLTGTTGDPAGLTTTLPGSTRPSGAPDNAFGFFRFTTQITETVTTP